MELQGQLYALLILSFGENPAEDFPDLRWTHKDLKHVARWTDSSNIDRCETKKIAAVFSSRTLIKRSSYNEDWIDLIEIYERGGISMDPRRKLGQKLLPLDLGKY